MVYVLFVACLLGLFCSVVRCLVGWYAQRKFFRWFCWQRVVKNALNLLSAFVSIIKYSTSVFFWARCTTKTFRFLKHFYTD